MSRERLFQVRTPMITAALIVVGGKVVRAAPSLRWTVGKPLAEVASWVARDPDRSMKEVRS